MLQRIDYGVSITWRNREVVSLRFRCPECGAHGEATRDQAERVGKTTLLWRCECGAPIAMQVADERLVQLAATDPRDLQLERHAEDD